MDTSNIIQIILVCIIPFIANTIQEIFRLLSKVKKSKCCGNEIELDTSQNLSRNNSKINLSNDKNDNKV